MKVLVACEFSGIVRDAFLARGHDAWSCDLLPAEKKGPHIQDDVLKHLDDGWDLMIAHPPCTYLAKSGVQYLHKDYSRWKLMRDATVFFLYLWCANIKKIAIENPVPHKYSSLPKYTQIIQPYQFGHNVQKMTCLWLKGLPKLISYSINAPLMNLHIDKGEKYFRKNGTSNGSKWYQLLTPGPERSKNRSRTFPGIAQAMAEQWG